MRRIPLVVAVDASTFLFNNQQIKVALYSFGYL